MNYKIRITAENQAIVKRVANENGMNPSNFEFHITESFYIIKDDKFYVGNVGYKEIVFSNYPEITTDQFIELFDKKETELDKWLRETKAKNLSLEKLKIYITNRSSCDDDLYKKLIIKLDIKDCISLADFLFNQWNNPTEENPKVETEWQPKRGDRVLVWDDSEDLALESIFLCNLEKAKLPIFTVTRSDEEEFLNNDIFSISIYKHMKPLPIEQPKETDFKTKVIELIENEIKDGAYRLEYLLNQIKQL